MERYRNLGFRFASAVMYLLAVVMVWREERHREIALQRLFSTFPGSWPGVGLLLLRAILGLTAMVQGLEYPSDLGNLTSGGWVVSSLLMASGVSLLIGFLTPIASILVGIGGLGVAFSWFPAPALNLFDTKLAITQFMAISAALAFLGPGAFSLDCRIFGRRELVIPPALPSPKS